MCHEFCIDFEPYYAHRPHAKKKHSDAANLDVTREDGPAQRCVEYCPGTLPRLEWPLPSDPTLLPEPKSRALGVLPRRTEAPSAP